MQEYYNKEEQFLSTPSARRATLALMQASGDKKISIHALREEGDAPPSFFGNSGGYFYPRPPRGGRPGAMLPGACAALISIHALREEGDDGGRGNAAASTNFYPRPPRGGRLLLVVSPGRRCTFLSTPSARRATD